ncbi:PAS domain-containing sensor histidine kinase [Fodinibius halophilus]|uniref:histidine kinase n=1 Tax=Fodinibius halophilus TaxID=1736908 RepID=A0A6M1T3P7_9BACT|nr:PAS domain S-box protein [Fodinibius halophilus]NGP88709.1 PAS domain S-box protein [Fodinibius halophilus]
MINKHIKKAYQMADIGHWELDVESGELYWSDEINRLHEAPLDYQPDLDVAINFFEEGEERKKVRDIMTKAIEKGDPFTLESKIITCKGNVRWVRAIGKAISEGGECKRVFGTIQDITTQCKAELEAQRARQEMQDVIEHSTIMFYRHDTDQNLLYISPQSKQFLGSPPEEVMQQWTEFVTDHPKNKEGLKRVEEAIKTGEPQPSYELQLERTDGKIIWVQVNESPVVEDGETVEIVGSLTDITSLKEQQQQVEEKEAQLRNIANNIDGMVHRYIMHPDDSYEFTFVSEGVRGLHEVTPEQVIETPDLLWEQIVDEHLDEVRQSVQESAEELKRWDQKWKIKTPSGQEKWIHGRGTPKQLEDGSVQWDTILLDVTSQKKLEQNVSRQVSLLNNILDSIPGLFYMIREDLTFARTNKNVESLFNLTSEQLRSTNALSLIAPRERTKAKQLIGKAFVEGYAELETILIGDDGQEHHYYMNGSGIELGKDRYVIGSGINITERVEAEEENTVLLREVHHRVKNNLAIISGILSLELDELPANDSDRSALERSVNRIHAIAKVHELLYRSTSFSQVNVKEYISELATTVINTLKAAGDIDIQLDIEEVEMNINETIPLGMLLNELLTNSVKYAFRDKQEGRIELNIIQHQQYYKVVYRDNGRGFDRAEFEQSTTLGLTIVKMLLQQLKADYEIDTDDKFEIVFTFDKRETGSHGNM